MARRLFLLLIVILPATLLSQNADIRLLRSINSPNALPSDRFFQFMSNSNVYIVIGIPAGMGMISLIKQNDKLFRNSCVIIAATVFNAGITTAMKYSVNRIRPFITYSDITKKSDAGTPSFPSGHTSSAFATATSLSFTYPKWYIIAPAYACAGIVGYSRMHLGVHYPSDVLVGAVVGAGCAWLTHAVTKKLIFNSKGRL
jgi:membrane-associated phospholipid phosphatase